MRLHLVRHGETDHNVARRIQGPLLDDPLNARGAQQAEALARRFAAEREKGLRLAAVYSSPLKRAWMTAEAVARAAGAPPCP
jgi:broad specificity phosphatase PhoE